MKLLVPMDSDIVSRIVLDFDNKCVSISDIQSWPWKLSIHRYNVPGFAQPLHCFSLNLSHTDYSIKTNTLYDKYDL